MHDANAFICLEFNFLFEYLNQNPNLRNLGDRHLYGTIPAWRSWLQHAKNLTVLYVW